uniref:Uncharacterized protein n=1 Tax=Anguilla anguilla TaxID=7936 RepID=A0A0E9XHJ6_ANGAN
MCMAVELCTLLAVSLTEACKKYTVKTERDDWLGFRIVTYIFFIIGSVCFFVRFHVDQLVHDKSV